ncbi:PTS sugar transporter subunit IIB [Humidisolicoccus flavus]|uniref:PTS sugar transporter subunit IIB n=1 Tax=Humidisolicoccus flavus TaxID=3111414 RepID=UPI00324D6774
MNIVVICGAGVGTSAILQVGVERALVKLDLEGAVSAADAQSLPSLAADAQVVMTTEAFADAARASGWADVIVIDNILDSSEIEAKLWKALGRD